MTQESHFYLWLKPAEPELTRLREVIERLSEHHDTPRFEPHVTLLSKLSGSLDTLTERILPLARNTPPLLLTCTGPDFKEEFYRCLFLTVAPSPPLSKLYQQSLSCLPNSDKRVFEPHVSLMYGDLSSSLKREIITELENNYPRTITIDSLVMCSAEGAPQDWRSVQEFTLGR